MNVIRAVTVLVLGLVGAAAAPPAKSWEPTAAGAAARIAAVTAWQNQVLGSEPGDERRGVLRKDVLGLATKDRAPDWTRKTSWRDRDGETSVAFGVGVVSGIEDRALALTTAENRARAAIAALGPLEVTREETPSGSRVTTSAAATLKGVVVVDWYVSPCTPTCTVYALAAQPEPPK